MSLLRAIRDVLANLTEGRDPTGVRPTADNSPAPESYKRRLLAIEQTGRFPNELRPSLRPGSHRALETAVASAQVALTSLPELLNHVSQVRAGQSVAVGRAGWAEDHVESKYAAELIALEQELRALLDEPSLSATGGKNPGASQGAA